MAVTPSDAPRGLSSVPDAPEPTRSPTGSLGSRAARVVAAVPVVAGAGRRLLGELGRVTLGRSEVAPAKGDRRFADPTWAENRAYHQMMQAYLAVCGAVGEVVEGVGFGDWRDRERARFVATLLTSTFAPTNALLGNPAAVKRAFETGGGSLGRGVRNFVDDVWHNGGMPRQVDRSAFTVGRDLAATPGAVVHRDEVLELLQYRPVTGTVRSVPIVVVPPQINKYYFMDLAPGRSLIEFAVGQGQQVFAISWRNPTSEQRDWDLDTYAGAIISALDVIADITRSEQVNVFGLCAGGITTSAVLNHLADVGDDRVRSASFGVTLLDWSAPAPVGMLSAPALLKLARWRSGRAGVLDGRSLGSVFTWMRPNDLVWNYVVSNYLLGGDPPTFDILAWNADSTNLPAALHGQFLDVFEGNALTVPGAMTVLGSPVDLSRVTVDAYVTGGTTDHLTPWNGCFASARLLGGRSTFVLANTGHIQTLVCPPGNPKSRYWTGAEPTGDPQAWRQSATEHTGSWWENWAGWIDARSGTRRKAPTRLGSSHCPPLDDAPGTYVFTQA
ncbi:alpha/beta fold hydrolase [Pseudonocardia sp.]|jgi:polyhydroxyalkanoate synthase|uniref:alpha/beta fold hydrolase n=1 Tax=Pseudonocardia sp. TaxID=60912 RepID=UPI00262A13CA|nr:alpha/beta fold hydrolase [Pseudonocardia sp.]MCW2721543.1 phaA [Pseudonocardia sp.]MDT7617331.1 poly[(R)-3-hydroxyalkanoate] polymerase subunit PhaC [Pseudonocardiales bacterium]